MRKLNERQKEIMGQFYSNFALALITFGLLSPVFTGVGNIAYFGVKFIGSIIFGLLFLQFSLDFLK